MPESRMPESRTKRIALLVTFLGCELLAVYSLRTKGWTGTGGALQLLLSLAIALLPLVAAIAVLLLRGRRFSLRSMMIATALFAVFISMILIPYTGAINRRRGVMALEAAMIPYSTESSEEYYHLRQIPFTLEPESVTRSSDDLSFWMTPLLDDSIPTYPDRAVRRLTLQTDQDIEVVAPLLSRFPNLENVLLVGPSGGLAGVSKAGAIQLGESFPPLEELTIKASMIPEDWGRSLPDIRSLSIVAGWPRESVVELEDRQLDGLLSVNGLEILTFDGIDINDSNVECIAKVPELKHLTLSRSNVTKEKLASLRKAYPLLDIRDGPHDLTPGYFLFSGYMQDTNTSMRITFNEDRDRWERRFVPVKQRMVYFGNGGAAIDKAFPIEVKIWTSDRSDPAFILRKISRLRRSAERKGLNEIGSEISTYEATVTFLGKESEAVD